MHAHSPHGQKKMASCPQFSKLHLNIFNVSKNREIICKWCFIGFTIQIANIYLCSPVHWNKNEYEILVARTYCNPRLHCQMSIIDHRSTCTHCTWCNIVGKNTSIDVTEITQGRGLSKNKFLKPHNILFLFLLTWENPIMSKNGKYCNFRWYCVSTKENSSTQCKKVWQVLFNVHAHCCSHSLKLPNNHWD